MNATSLFNELIKNSVSVNKDLDELCLISREKLDDTKVILPQCKHQFNYVPLYKEIVNQKVTYKNHFRLKLGQIMCPYCRIVYNGLLPFLPLQDVYNLYGITYPKSLLLKINNCKYVKRNKEECAKNCVGEYCNLHVEKAKNKIIKEKEKVKEKVKNEVLCNYEFKKGKRKGEKCCKKIKDNEGEHCKQHTKKV